MSYQSRPDPTEALHASLPAEADGAVDGGPPPAKGGSTFTAHLARMAGFGLVILAAATVVTLI